MNVINQAGFYCSFGISRTNLGIVGLWPTRTKLGKIFSTFTFAISITIIITFVTIAQTAKLYMIWGELDQMTDNISTANLPIAVVLLKMLIFRSNKKELANLLSFAMNDWTASKTKQEEENMFGSAKIARKMSLICVILGFGSVNGQLAVRASQELNILPGPPEKRLPMISSYFPYDYKSTPAYEITWLMQYLGAGLATVVYSGVYCLFVGLVLHLRGQVANLRHRLESHEINGYDRELAGKEFRKHIRVIVDRHQCLNRFAEGIENIFSVMFLAEILSCTIQICLQMFLLVTLISDKEKGLPILQILFMMIYVMHVGTHVFICCYAADKLRDESVSIYESAYNILWYNLPPQDAKLLIIVMHRAEKPLQVTAGKFCTFSLRLYAQILKTSGGYLSMLLAVRERITGS